MRFEPEGMTSNPEIPFAKSMPDYIMRWLASRFLDTDLQEELGILTKEVRAAAGGQGAGAGTAAGAPPPPSPRGPARAARPAPPRRVRAPRRAAGAAGGPPWPG